MHHGRRLENFKALTSFPWHLAPVARREGPGARRPPPLNAGAAKTSRWPRSAPLASLIRKFPKLLMKPYQGSAHKTGPRPAPIRSFALSVAALWLILPNTQAGPTVGLWDTGSPFTDPPDRTHQADWKRVPTELFSLETDPAKAASDPGYYGREYSFQGDALVENTRLSALFSSAQGRVVLYAKPDVTPASGPSAGTTGWGQKIGEIIPLSPNAPTARIRHLDVLRNAGDEVVLSVTFAAPPAADVTTIFTFGKNEIVEIHPTATMSGVRMQGAIAYGVVPGFIGDDLIFGPTESPATTLALPAENMFLGLLPGEASTFVLTWPPGRQQLQLQQSARGSGPRTLTSVDLTLDGQSVYLAASTAPGLWHREELKPAFLEKDVALTWKKPFPARWKTQFAEAGVKTTFAFHDSPGQIWRGVPGSYSYPAWFNGDQAFYHLSKKVPPKGESLIYFLEGQDTPPGYLTPVDVLQATLGRSASAPILDVAGRRLRTHHRRGGESVHRACTCGYTEAIQVIFEAGQETTRRDYIKEAVEDMNYFVQRHVERIDEYQRFAAEITRFLQSTGTSAPELKPYLQELESIVRQIPQEFQVQQENMKSREHAQELTRQTLALTAAASPNNLATYKELLKSWRAMGGAQDYVVAQCHMIARKLFQEAGYGATEDPRRLTAAREIRNRCRQILRNPDGYEIWADY